MTFPKFSVYFKLLNPGLPSRHLQSRALKLIKRWIILMLA
jgi:hypothetical protein